MYIYIYNTYIIVYMFFVKKCVPVKAKIEQHGYLYPNDPKCGKSVCLF